MQSSLLIDWPPRALLLLPSMPDPTKRAAGSLHDLADDCRRAGVKTSLAGHCLRQLRYRG
jgi:hypothetical protein